MGPLTDKLFWGDILENTKNVSKGLLSATVGAPADIATMLMRPFGYNVPDKRVVGSTEWFGGLLGADTESTPFKVATLLPTDAGDLMRYGGLLGTFAGVNAKTANKALLEAAEKMDKAGVDRTKIWQDTGWFKGPEGKWRFEIDDSAASARTYNYTPQEALKVAKERAIIDGAGGKRVQEMEPYAQMSRSQLSDEYKRTGQAISQAAMSGNRAEADKLVSARGGLEGLLSEMAQRDHGPASAFLKHKELGAAYPDVYKLHTRIAPDDLLGSARAQYQPSSPMVGEQVVLQAPPKRSAADKSSLLHELQHAIQQREGFASGGNPTQVFDDVDAQVDKLTDPLFKQLRELSAGSQGLPSTTARPLIDEIQRLRSPQEIYRRLAGEAEARAVQSRMNLSPAERRAKAPWESYDVPWDQLIVRGQDGGGLLAASSKPTYGGAHRPMTIEGGAAAAHDLEATFGKDIYGPKALQYFGSGDPREQSVLRVLTQIRGKPDAEVTIYRGIPKGAKGEFNAGDWVTLDKSVAADYGEQVIAKKVKAKDITSWADSLLEFGYYPGK